MDPNSIPGGIYSAVQSGGMLGLEMSIHQPPPPPRQNPPTSHLLPNTHHHQILNYAQPDESYLPPAHQPTKQAHQFPSKPKAQTLTLSDDEDPAFTAETTSADDGRKKVASPWQRMKWTDNMVRLLIMIVFYIGDEVVSEAAAAAAANTNTAAVAADKKKGALQKKGKWKSVSRAMMERGFYVSPQQCEDKFNDLNKRYKRVNDILGKGVSCRVVENQSLLDSMDHVSPKMKDEVRKLLNSKHLFFREMCAYHNSCAGAGGGGPAAEPPPPPPPATAAQPQKCLHSTSGGENINNNNSVGLVVPNLNRAENEGTKLSTSSEDDDDDVDDDDVDDDGDEDDDENLSDNRRRSSRKMPRRENGWTRQLDSELASVLEDGGKSRAEKRQVLKARMARLEEERVGIQTRAFEIEKRRLKWLRYSGNKEREMEKERLTNERLRLENERMLLVIRQKELDLLEQHSHLQQQYSSTNRKSDPSSVTG
ncbi:sequence-specific DNA binding transcription factors [Striga hermonthica]|uniref:Sequence-specific DNA binding transcription factors n=1 Tax=Striga hermonthica TaxID=68872 RepID=A0A9N7NEL6_STRHE|nr:sequence-specific DNA binding transcription factors [Striga hermonthica]